MEVLVREVSRQDAREVMLLSQQLGYDISLPEINANIETLLKDDDNKVFVAEHNNNVIGWIGAALVLTIQSLPFCEIRGLVVDEKFRKNNIGKLLLEKAIKWSKEKGCKKLRVRCNVKRKDTHAFYMHLGFTEKKEQKIFEINV